MLGKVAAIRAHVSWRPTRLLFIQRQAAHAFFFEVLFMSALSLLRRCPATSAFKLVSLRLIGLSAVLAFRLPAQSAGVQKPDTMHRMAGMPGMAGDTMPGMAMSFMPLGIPMQRLGSGTTWLPDSSPMHAHHMMAGSWELMLHGVAFGVYDKQNGPRGAEQFSSINWGMLMATRSAGGGQLQLRGMMSVEPFTVGAQGYPLLVQTGETYRGQPLFDRQHPHDLFMELATVYDRAIAKNLGVSLYLAPVGEPSSGLVAFPHRPSAAADPLAPIGHHWQDATHVSFGVVTAGIFTHNVRLESSIFNGREPDENRTNFDYSGRSLDSYSGRLTWNPSGQWSVAGSYAYLKSPESFHPDESIHRLTASVINARTFGRDGSWSSTFVYGANRPFSSRSWEPSFLLESNLETGGPHIISWRLERVRKNADEFGFGAGAPVGTFDVGAVVGSYAYEFDRIGTVRTAVGLRGSVNFVPQEFSRFYGGSNPTGFAVYVRFRPQSMSQAAHDGGTHGAMQMPGMKTPPAAHDSAHGAPSMKMPSMRDTSMRAMPGMTDTAMRSMPGMRDTAMRTMPGMRDTAMRSMPGMRDTAMRAMPGMPDTAMRTMPGMRDTSMRSMPGMKAGKRDTSMRSMPGMKDAG